MLKQTFPDGIFGTAARQEAIAAVEAELGLQFPDQLRCLYLECDGFREDKGNAAYLFCLTGDKTSLVTLTRFFWTEFREVWPSLDLTRFVFFGSSAGDEFWGIRCNGPEQVIAFHHNMEGDFEVVGLNIVDVYRVDYLRYGGHSGAQIA